MFTKYSDVLLFFCYQKSYVQVASVSRHVTCRGKLHRTRHYMTFHCKPNLEDNKNNNNHTSQQQTFVDENFCTNWLG